MPIDKKMYQKQLLPHEDKHWSRVYAQQFAEGKDIFNIPLIAQKAEMLIRMATQLGLTPSDGIKVIEIGCGHGQFLIPFERCICKYIQQYQLIGYDISPKSIATAQNWAINNDSQIAFRVGSCDSIQERADWILLIDVVEHVYDPYSFLLSVKGLSDYIWLHLPIEQSFGHITLKRPMNTYRKSTHLHFWSWQSANILLEECGYPILAYEFDAVQIRPTFNSNLLRLMWWFRRWSYKLMPHISPHLFGGSVMFLLKNSK